MPHIHFGHRALLAAIAAVCALTLVLSTGAGAQERDAELTITQLDASQYPQITAVVTALRQGGLPTPGLTAESFQAFEDDKQLNVQAATAVQDSALPLSVIVVIDVSGSMEGPPLDAAKAAAIEFVRSLGPNDEAALLAFSSDVVPVTSLTTDKELLASAISLLQPSGATSLYAASQVAIYSAASAATSRRAVVFLTDGQNDSPDTSYTAEGSIDAARLSGIPVFSIGFGAAPDASYLQALSTATRGQYRAATQTTLPAVYGEIAALLRNQYVLTLLADDAPDGASANIRLIAELDGQPVAAVREFARGVAPAVPAGVPTVAVEETDEGGGSNTPLMVFSLLVVIVLAAIAIYFLVRWWRNSRTRAFQMDVIAANPQRASAQPLPSMTGGYRADDEADGPGRLVEKSNNGSAVIYRLGAGPIVIGSSPRDCTIVLPASLDVAPEHVRIWLRDGRYLLHHAGGLRRKTLVGGKEADWITLEPGDEVTVGHHLFVYDEEL